MKLTCAARAGVTSMPLRATSKVPRSSEGISVGQSFWTIRARTPSAARQRIGQVDLEAAERAAARRILEGVGLSPLFVGAPEQLAARRNPRQSSAIRPVFGRGAGHRRREQHHGTGESEPRHPCVIPIFVTARPGDVTRLS